MIPLGRTHFGNVEGTETTFGALSLSQTDVLLSSGECTEVERQNDAALSQFSDGGCAGKLILQYNTPDELRRLSPMLRDMVQTQGKRLLLAFGDTNVTLTASNLDQTIDHLINGLSGDDDALPNESDAWRQFASDWQMNDSQGQDGLVRELVITDFDATYGEIAERQIRSGAFFPFKHSYRDAYLKEILARYGCFDEVDPANYTHNCLYIACKQAGASESMLSDVQSKCLNASVPLAKLGEIATRNDVIISVLVPKTGEAASKKTNTKYFGGTAKDAAGKKIIKLALIDKHFIVNEKVEITAWALKNYETIKHQERWWQFVKSGMRSATVSRMHSYDLLARIEKQPINAEDSRIYETYHHSLCTNLDNASLYYPDGAVRLFNKTERSNSFTEKVFFDIETSTRMHNDPEENIALMKRKILREEGGAKLLEKLLWSVDETNIRAVTNKLSSECCHQVYLLCFACGDDGAVESLVGRNCARQLLDTLAERYGRDSETEDENGVEEDSKTPSILLIAHNATYDYQALMPYLGSIRFINKGTNLVCGSAMYTRFMNRFPGDERRMVLRIEFKDSYKLLTMPLRDFAPAFNLDVKKEVMPHNWYTEANVFKRGAFRAELVEHAGGDLDELLSNLEELGCRKGDEYDMIKYSNWYCEQDVRVLRAGYNVFRDSMLEATTLDIDDYPTLSSVADMHMFKSGVYEGVYEVSGIVQQFISRASIGGRCMCRNNRRSISKNMVDFDAVSLYPSGMVRLPGFLMGAPKVWDSSVDLDVVDGYFVEIAISEIGRVLPFPVACIQTKAGNDWTNDLVGKKLVVDKWTLEDLVRHQGVEYVVLRGYYFDEGRNPRVKEIIKDMFEQRLYYKDKTRFPDGNPLQLIFKLLMNTSYGICGLKPIETDIHYEPTKRLPKFLDRHYNSIKNFTAIGRKQHRIECYKALNDTFNRIHCASEVLSMSKTIMNEPFVLAEDLGILITYQDTDSMHISADKVNDLAYAFRQKYGRELIGKGLGQFHTDFDYEQCFAVKNGELGLNTVKSVGEIVATESIIIAKKTYLDVLKDEAGSVAYHVRGKGISHRVLVDTVNERFDGDLVQLYHDLYDGKAVDFDFSINKNIVFKRKRDHRTYTSDLVRRIQFPAASFSDISV